MYPMPKFPLPSTHSPEPNALLRLWMLRLLVPMGGARSFVHDNGFENDQLAEAVGLGELIENGDSEFDARQARSTLRKRHAAAENARTRSAVPSTLARNRNRLSALVRLTATDCRILDFAVLLHNERLLDDTADLLGNMCSAKVLHTLSVVLELPEANVRAALSGSGQLTKSGLVSLERCGAGTLRAKLNLLSDSFADRMLTAELDPIQLLRDTVASSKPPELTLADFAHLDDSLAILRPYLRHALDSERKGVNVFLYGDPGTGKTQLARVLAQELGCELFEVASEDTDGDPVPGDQRLRSFRAAQCCFGKRRALLLFDETEDVFKGDAGLISRRGIAQRHKGWINRMLEDNPVATLWLSNDVDCLDPAFIRRFDLVLEIPVPPRRQRERIVASACGDLLDAPAVARIVEAEALAPAVLTRAAAVVQAIRTELPADRISRAVEHLVESTLIAQGHPRLRRGDANGLPDHYDPRFINVDADLAAIAQGLASSKSGRLCLYGPPGTGKSAFVRWLANQMAVPLYAKRASDLISPWLGMTERNLAAAFREAEQDGAILLLDEVDSFLQDRRNAQRSWEVTEVNEMLTQMESFGGILSRRPT